MYITRTIENYFRKAASQFPVMLVTGARQVGKTTLLRHLSDEKRLYVTLDDSGLYRLAGDVLYYKPDCVFIQYAINDAFSGFTEQQFKKNIKGIIEKINENANTDIILITSGYIGDNDDNRHMERYYHQLTALGEDYHIPVALVHEYWKEKVRDGIALESLVQYDGVHPTEGGYRLMAEAVMKLFEINEKRQSDEGHA